MTINTERRRRIWNYQCKECKAEAPVFLDNEQCEDCDLRSRGWDKPFRELDPMTGAADGE